MADSSPLIYCDLIEEKPRKQKPDETAEHYAAYLDSFQPWRVIVKSGDNQKKLFRSTERYLHRAGAITAIQLAFGNNSNVFLREKEQGNVNLRRPSAEAPF
jgi:uncharacterized protein YegP (UPF0339 family)